MQLQRHKALHSSCYHSVKYLLAIFNILKITSKFNSIICILYKGNHYNTTLKALWWSMEQRCSTFTRSSKGTTNGSSVRMARCLSSDTDSCGGSKPTKKNNKKNPTMFDILAIDLMQGIRHFLLVFIQNSYLVIFVQITVKKTHDLNTLCFLKKNI